LAEANAKVAEIPLNRLVRVLSATDGGDYYKASADATSLTKSPWDPVAQAKADATTKANAAESNAKAYFRNNGFARLVLAASGSIDYNTETKELTFSGTIRVVTNNETTQTLTVPQVLTLTSVAPYRIEYSFDTNTLHAVNSSSNRAANRIVLGSTTVDGGSFKAEGFPFTLNGNRVFQSHVGELISTSVPTRINFNNVDKKLILAPAVLVRSSTYAATISSLFGPSNLEVAYPSATGIRRLVFNLVSKQFSFVTNDIVSAQNLIELATVEFTAEGVTNVKGIADYGINGVIPPASTNAATASTTATLAASDPSTINFDFENKKLIMPANKVRLNYDKISLFITTALEINFAETPGPNYWHKFIYNKETKVFSAKQFSSSLADNELVFALIQPSTKSVYGVADYYVDGKPSKTLFPAADFLYTLCDAKPRYE
ncbi:hypothetical protein KTI59_15850, partial [Acinetobacter radioresistens]|uniref:hypothetical protein n=1 Tax=Acinetobacter radioresistens TaxID=40216 RepID=UPI0021CD7D23